MRSRRIPTPAKLQMRERKSYFVCIMGSLSGTLSIGVTSPPENRLFQHKEHMSAGFTSKYDVDRLLYWESFDGAYGHRPRKATQRLASKQEDCFKRMPESPLARFEPRVVFANERRWRKQGCFDSVCPVASDRPTYAQHDTSPRKITPTQHPCVGSEPHPVNPYPRVELPSRRLCRRFSSALNGITVPSTVSPQQPHSGIFTLVALCLTLPADTCHSDHDRRRRLQGNR
jgi:predicted GIY-YIG superfamily endonuclease